MIHTSLIPVALVDDHKIFRKGLVEVLKHLGYHIIAEASNGQELLEKLEHSPLPGICIVDVHMPFMDGFETTRRLKLLYPSIKILALSTDNSDLTVAKIISCGADHFLEKGGNLDDINRILKQLQPKS
jgi:DNA-binding NarL/FixJ family response regulator